MVGDVDHCEQDPNVVFSGEGPDARVDVFGVQAMVFEA